MHATAHSTRNGYRTDAIREPKYKFVVTQVRGGDLQGYEITKHIAVEEGPRRSTKRFNIAF